MENWEKLKSADIRTVKRDELIDITRIPKDDSDCEDKEKTQGVLLPVRSNEKEYFFEKKV